MCVVFWAPKGVQVWCSPPRGPGSIDTNGGLFAECLSLRLRQRRYCRSLYRIATCYSCIVTLQTFFFKDPCSLGLPETLTVAAHTKPRLCRGPHQPRRPLMWKPQWCPMRNADGTSSCISPPPLDHPVDRRSREQIPLN